MDVKLQALILCILFCLFHESKEMARNRFGKCLKCPPGWGATQTCTKKVNTICQRCTFGKTYSSKHSSKSPCWVCSKCGIGLYEAHKCTPIRDTVCSECLSYIDHRNLTKQNDFKEKCSYLFLQR